MERGRLEGEGTMRMDGITASELAQRLNGTLFHCPPERRLHEVLPLEQAGAAALSFLANLCKI